MNDLLRGVKEREGPKMKSIFLSWVTGWTRCLLSIERKWGWIGKEPVNEKVTLESWS